MSLLPYIDCLSFDFSILPLSGLGLSEDRSSNRHPVNWGKPKHKKDETTYLKNRISVLVCSIVFFFQSPQAVRWFDPGWRPGAYKSHSITLLLYWAGERKYSNGSK